MNTALIVDSNCDLPTSVIDKHNIIVIPTNLTIDGDEYLDYRDVASTTQMYNGDRLDKRYVAKSEAASEALIQKILTEKVSGKFDSAVIQTMSRKRSMFFERVGSVVTRIQDNSQTKFRILDSKSLFTGQGVVAAHTTALMNKGIYGSSLRKKLDELTPYLYGYSIPKDLFYLRERGSQRGEKSVSFAKAAVGKALGLVPIVRTHNESVDPVKSVRGWDNAVELLFNNVCEQMKAGLRSPFVCISYAGNINEIESLPNYKKLAMVAKDNRIHILKSQMAVAGGVNIGPGAMSIAFASQHHVLS